MIETLRLYIEQRFPALKFLGLALFVFLFALPFEVIGPLSLLQLLKVLFMIFTLRLYDDVMQWENDSLFSERVYTHKESREKLIFPLVVFMFCSVIVNLNEGADFVIMTFWLYFLVVNHIMYKALVQISFCAFLLPILKYPVLYFYLIMCNYINEDFDVSNYLNSAALMLSLILYDRLDSRAEREFSLLNCLLLVSSISFLLIGNMSTINFIASISVLLLSLASILLNLKSRLLPMAWLILVLIFKLISNNYVL